MRRPYRLIEVVAVAVALVGGGACDGAGTEQSLAAHLREQHGWSSAQSECVATYVERNLGEAAADVLRDGGLTDLPPTLQGAYAQLVVPCLALDDDG